MHMRYLIGSIIDWDQLFKEAFKALKPGGYVESYESSPYMVSDDGTVVEGSAMHQWGELFVSAKDALGGRTFTVVDDGLQRSGMEAAGFVDIEERNVKVSRDMLRTDTQLITFIRNNRILSVLGPRTRSTSSRDVSLRSPWSRILRATSRTWLV